MKLFGLTMALWLLGMNSVQAEHYETYAFGDTEAQACDLVKTELTDRAILRCKMNGGFLAKAEYGECRTKLSASKRQEAVRSVEFSCK